MRVLQIKPFEAEPWCLEKHYAKRMPIVTFAFGLYDDGKLDGIVTFGPTPTPAVQQNILGPEWAENVLELNRLVVSCKEKNSASFLVASALQLLPKPKCVVSYADTNQGHVGYIYQATNFLYTGAVTAHDSEYMLNGKKVHARTLTASGITAPKEWALANNVEQIKPKPKHRYVFFCGNKYQKKEMRRLLRYEVVAAYPKGESARYDAGAEVKSQGLLFA